MRRWTVQTYTTPETEHKRFSTNKPSLLQSHVIWFLFHSGHFRWTGLNNKLWEINSWRNHTVCFHRLNSDLAQTGDDAGPDSRQSCWLRRGSGPESSAIWGFSKTSVQKPKVGNKTASVNFKTHPDFFSQSVEITSSLHLSINLNYSLSNT